MMTYVISNIAPHSQEEQLTTIYGQDTMERILEHEGEVETPRVPQRPRQTTLEGKRSGCMWPHCPSPSPVQCSTTPRSLPWACSFSSVKREPWVGIQLAQHCGSLPGSPYSSLAPLGLQENVQGLTTGNLIATTSTQVLADRVPTCSTQAVVQPAALLIWRSNLWHSPTSEHSSVQVCLILVLKQSFLTWNLVCLCQLGELSHLCHLFNVASGCSQPENLIRKTWEASWSWTPQPT